MCVFTHVTWFHPRQLHLPIFPLHPCDLNLNQGDSYQTDSIFFNLTLLDAHPARKKAHRARWSQRQGRLLLRAAGAPAYKLAFWTGSYITENSNFHMAHQQISPGYTKPREKKKPMQFEPQLSKLWGGEISGPCPLKGRQIAATDKTIIAILDVCALCP